jgi:branched-chain amino acid transport system substrate-binding protein
MRPTRRDLLESLAYGAVAAAATPASAHKRYDPGASDTEIRIGNIMPYSGPASAYGINGKTIAAYFDKINADGGINGRRIRFISYDDGYSPPKTIEQARKLVEGDEVLLIFYSLGTAPNSAIRKYMNIKQVPQLFVASGASKWNDPKNFPWTMGWAPSTLGEGCIYAQYLRQNHADGRIGILYQNDDFGKDYLKGLKDGLAGKIAIVAESSYETTDPTIDSQIVGLKTAGADIFLNVTSPKFAAQAIKKAAEIDWKPLHFLNNVSRSIGAVLRPAGFANAQGILSAGYTKDATDPTWSDDPAFKEWSAFMDQYYPAGDRTDSLTVTSYTAAQTLVAVLERCGDDLARANVMRAATSLVDLRLGMLLPGISINTGADDYAPLEQMQMMRFAGEQWHLFGPILGGGRDCAS